MNDKEAFDRIKEECLSNLELHIKTLRSLEYEDFEKIGVRGDVTFSLLNAIDNYKQLMRFTFGTKTAT